MKTKLITIITLLSICCPLAEADWFGPSDSEKTLMEENRQLKQKNAELTQANADLTQSQGGWGTCCVIFSVGMFCGVLFLYMGLKSSK